jgi:hypothetical protein
MHNPISPHGHDNGPQPPAKKGGFGGSSKKENKSLSSSRGGIITRVSPNINLSSIMDEKGTNGGERARWAFWNMGRLFSWAEEGGTTVSITYLWRLRLQGLRCGPCVRGPGPRAWGSGFFRLA